MTNCPYCKSEVNKEFSQRTPEGKHWHFPCADSGLDELIELREKMQKINDIAVNYQEDGPFIDTVTFAIISEIYDLSLGKE